MAPSTKIPMAEGEIEDEVALLEEAAVDIKTPQKAFTKQFKVAAALVTVLLVGACIAASVGAGKPTPEIQSDLEAHGKSNIIQDFSVTKKCNAVSSLVQDKVNKGFGSMQDSIKVNKEIELAGPEVKIVCKAKSFLIFEVEEISGVSSGNLAVTCDDASAAVTTKWNVAASTALSFKEDLSVQLKLKEKGSFCHVPHSWTQKLSMTISGLNASTSIMAAGMANKVKSVELDDLSLKFTKFGFNCDGDECSKARGPGMKILKKLLGKGVMGIIQNEINKQLADLMPMTLG